MEFMNKSEAEAEAGLYFPHPMYLVSGTLPPHPNTHTKLARVMCLSRPRSPQVASHIRRNEDRSGPQPLGQGISGLGAHSRP